MTLPRIIRNAAQCAACQDIIESTHRHDFRSCSCGTIFVDGGKEYLRRGGDFALLIELSEMEEPSKCSLKTSQSVGPQ